MRTGADPAPVSSAAVRKTLDLPSDRLSDCDSNARFPALFDYATARSAMLLTAPANLHPFRMECREADLTWRPATFFASQCPARLRKRNVVLKQMDAA